jgi:hypothetical protein
MPVDVLASEQHFADHCYPIWQALKEPGDFILTHELVSTKIRRWEGANANITDKTRPILVASYGDLKRARRQGRTRIARIEHGAGQSYIGPKLNSSYAGGTDAADVSLMLVPNQYSADLWRRSYPEMQVEIVGCPKLDSLPRKDPSEPLTVAVSFHWDGYLVPETISAFNHYRSVLPQLAEAYNLIGHGHPRAIIGPPMLERRYRRMNIELVPDFAEVCRRADLYICDNSSSLFEFAATGRPVIVLNSPQYRRNIEHGLRFWDAADVGIQVDHPSDLLAAVATALQDGPQQRKARKQALAMVYAYPSGAAQRAASVLGEWAVRMEKAA